MKKKDDSSVETAKMVLEKEKQKRCEACMKEINAVLEKYECRFNLAPPVFSIVTNE